MFRPDCKRLRPATGPESRPAIKVPAPWVSSAAVIILGVIVTGSVSIDLGPSRLPVPGSRP